MIEQLTFELRKEIEKITDVDQRIDTINWIRKQIHGVSPLRNHPTDFVMWVRCESVEANDYNPNHVDTQNMKALEQSMDASGVTMSVVGDTEVEISNSLSDFLGSVKSMWVKIVDGFHRTKTIRRSKRVNESTLGRTPVSFIRNDEKSRSARIAATVLHNRARGVHGIEPMSGLVVELIQDGFSDAEIAVKLGMDADEVLRLKQTSGIAEIFKNLNYSQAWDFKEI